MCMHYATMSRCLQEANREEMKRVHISEDADGRCLEEMGDFGIQSDVHSHWGNMTGNVVTCGNIFSSKERKNANTRTTKRIMIESV